MTYRLKFLPAALKEWEKLGAPIKNQFKKKLAERLENPRVPADKLTGYDSVYKIKLRSAGYRLAYEVVDNQLLVYVLAVGKRDKSKVYASLKRRK
ncbi:type II toxin-antitoxin system RelE/ParE family toxin [Alkalimonas collagenimarina]|uniref:Type II toxin-antitoxin system RelE/ParE family toxin n=1 Tax=Alkalimonas collagenimarina TaxID=400390 RepID=A0ABT9H3A5_9GAMM|nr:type II toxin-antitoxin system RelE/ParE family toxin [Alkalimonas collagenimarina]MDP4537798.1 type II toxin-antitoxin system RelE/ParE family toxin [Alkalimonas collagenimarina]